MTPDQLSQALLHCVRRAAGSGRLPGTAVPGRVVLRRAPHGAPGWSTAVAHQLAGPAGRTPDEVAHLLRDTLREETGITDTEVRDGFLTVRLDGDADTALLAELLARPAAPPLPADTRRDIARWSEATGGDPARLLPQRTGNPLFRVRYAHARCRHALRWAGHFGLTPRPAPAAHPAERALLGALGQWSVAGNSPQRLVEVAGAWLTAEAARSTLPVGDEKPGTAHRARLALAQATATVLAGGLTRLGVSAPQHL
ncbi:DALR anticodon-binding domain-containing protein [Streptomyces sp. NPDC059853]|uniref:arginine--tRNA ligase n=1 Tax=Streptomyces sp. NPDC059853 TaxID=3346973 RepID=UPI0036544084